MNEIIKEYEKLINRLSDSDKWLTKNNISSWEECKTINPKVYKLREDIVKQIELIQNTRIGVK